MNTQHSVHVAWYQNLRLFIDWYECSLAQLSNSGKKILKKFLTEKAFKSFENERFFSKVLDEKKILSNPSDYFKCFKSSIRAWHGRADSIRPILNILLIFFYYVLSLLFYGCMTVQCALCKRLFVNWFVHRKVFIAFMDGICLIDCHHTIGCIGSPSIPEFKHKQLSSLHR